MSSFNWAFRNSAASPAVPGHTQSVRSPDKRTPPYLPALIRLAQFAMSLALLAILARDAKAGRKPVGYSQGKWIYGLVVAGLSAPSLMFLSYRMRGWEKAYVYFVAEILLLILWAVLFALFSQLTLTMDDNIGQRARSLQRAVLLQLTNTMLFLFTAGLAAEESFLGNRVYAYRRRARRTENEGRRDTNEEGIPMDDELTGGRPGSRPGRGPITDHIDQNAAPFATPSPSGGQRPLSSLSIRN